MYQHTVTLRSLANPEKKQRVIVKMSDRDYPSIVIRVREDYSQLLRTHEIKGIRSVEVR